MILPDICAMQEGDKPLLSFAQLSFAQQRLWFIHQLEGQSNLYNLPIVLQVEGQFNPLAFKQAVYCILERHKVLRSAFHDDHGHIYQTVKPISELPVEEVDLSQVTDELQETLVQRLIRNDILQAFDLKQGILLRVQIFKQSLMKRFVLLNLHHIAADRYSINILLEELGVLYTAFSKEQGNPLQPLSVQYADYANWQRQWLQGEILDTQLGYWQEYLAGIPQIHNLPLDKPRPVKQGFSGSQELQHIDSQLYDRINDFCQQYDVTRFVFLQTVFVVLLSRYSNETDIVIGSPITGRSHKAVEPLIGLFSNMLVLRSKLEGDPDFLSLLLANKHYVREAYTHQYIPYELLIEKLQPNRSLSHNPLFQILLTVQDDEQKELVLPQLTMKPVNDYEVHIAKYDLELYIDGKPDGLCCRWIYDKGLFAHETIQRMMDNFLVLLKSALAAPDHAIQELPLLTAHEYHTLLVEWNDTATDYPGDLSVSALFEVQAGKTPEKTALIYGDKQLSYQQLNEQANQLAHYLRELNITPGSLVGLYIDRSIFMPVAILAVLKTGAAYVPLDPTYPEARIHYMLQDSAVSIVLTENRYMPRQADSAIQWVCLNDPGTEKILTGLDKANTALNKVSKQSDSCAYVIYTSGSTGQPKGVKGSHQGIINRLCWMQRKYPCAEDDVFCQKTSISFVDHVAELFQPLLSGATLVIIADNDVKDLDGFKSQINRYGITRVTLVPSLLNLLLLSKNENELNSLRYIISSGEALPYSVVDLFHRKFSGKARLLNVYGSTEVAADVTCYEAGYYQHMEVLRYFGEGKVDEYGLNREQITEPHVSLQQLFNNFKNVRIPDHPQSLDEYLGNLKSDLLPYLINVSSEKYIGHMTSALPSFMPDFSGLITRYNQNVVKIETSKSMTLMERQVLAMMHKLFYQLPDSHYEQHGQEADYLYGIITSGGSLANISAICCARNKSLNSKGIDSQYLLKHGAIKSIEKLGYKDMVILVSPLAHYSIKKSVALLGLGENNLLTIEQDSKQKIIVDRLERLIEECRVNKRFIIAMIGIAGATETGTIDPLYDMAAIAKKHHIHFHADAAWGGAFIFSDQYKYKLAGIEQADSITFCAHKQLYLPQGISLCLFKDPRAIFANTTHADYQAAAGSFDLGQFTLEGSRPANSLLLHASLHLLAKNGYAWLIDQGMDKARYFKMLIQEHEEFELIGDYELNIINYRYLPVAVRKDRKAYFNDADNKKISQAVEIIQQRQFDEGKTFVSKTKILHRSYGNEKISVFRVVLSNPLTNYDDLHEVLLDQLRLAAQYVEEDDSKHSQSIYKPGRSRNKLPNYIEEIDKYSVPIGRPIDNVQLHILDSCMSLVPIGVIGEIYIGGDCLAEGYLNQPELTAQRFVLNPFSQKQNNYLFKTGDLARRLGNGHLEYVGRTDFQIKIRGFRIEPDEIEQQILQQQEIKEALVMPGIDNDYSKCLIAYITMSSVVSSFDTLISDLRIYLKDTLPDYMVPSIFIPLSVLPLTPNGKVDRKALPVPNHKDLHKAKYAVPNGPIENYFYCLWKRLLKIEKIGIHDDFFALGGHSLLAMEMVDIARRELGLEFPLSAIFEYPSIAKLSAVISQNN